MEFETSDQLKMAMRYDAIGVTPQEYREAIDAFNRTDTATILRIAKKSQKVLTEREGNFSPSTREQFFDEKHASYQEKRAKLHADIITDALIHGEPSNSPVITFLAGPPGVGKSLYKSKWFARSGVVETDPDAMKAKLLPQYDGLNPLHVQMTHDESLDIAQMILDAAIQKQYPVVCETTLRNVPWMRAVMEKGAENGYTSDIIFLHKPLSQCFQDAFERSERPISLPMLLSSVHGYDNLHRLGGSENTEVNVEVIDMTSAKSGTISRIVRNASELNNSAMADIMKTVTPYRAILSSL